MLAKLQMVLEAENKERMPYKKAVVLQSILMSKINQEYAEFMHESGLHPYSQSIEVKAGKNVWSIFTTNIEAYEQIIKPLASAKFEEFFIEKDQCRVWVREKELAKIKKAELTEKYYFEDASRCIEIEFITPVAFKSQNQYVFYPNLRLIYQSLVNKYEAVSGSENVNLYVWIEQLVQNTSVKQYNLKSCYYQVGKARIPAFMGKMKLGIEGSQSIVNFANLLFEFGEYSGLGIKTAMGMGNMKIIK